MISEYPESRDKTMEVKTGFRGKTYDKVYSGLKDKTSEGVYFRLKDNTSDMSILCQRTRQGLRDMVGNMTNVGSEARQARSQS